MTDRNTRILSRRYQRMNRHYRRVIVILCGIILLLFLLLLTSQNTAVQADEMVVTTYQSVQILPGDSLWSYAEQYRLSNMPVEEYIKEVRSINHLRTNDLVSGQYLILPIYQYKTSI